MPGESTTVRFIVDPSELEELGLSPSQMFGPSGQAPPMPSPGDVAAGGAPTGGGGGGKGGGVMTAAVVGALTGGILGMLDFFKQLLSNSKVLNTYAQAFGKVFSAAMDMLLLPFLPVLNLMLAGVAKLVAWLITSGYLERMSRYVNEVLVPLMQGVGAGLAHIWEAMNQTLDPRKWNWAELGMVATSILESGAALLFGTLERAFGLSTANPQKWLNDARSRMGQNPVNDATFEKMLDAAAKTGIAAMITGGLLTAATPFAPVSASAGAGTAGALSYGANAVADVFAPTDVGGDLITGGGGGGGGGGGRRTISAVVNVTPIDAAAQKEASDKATRDHASQISSQVVNR